MAEINVMFQLPMWPGERQDYLERHDFYVEQVKARVFKQFSDVPAQADRFTSEQYDFLCSSTPYRDDIDVSDLAEEAMERGAIFYGLLSDLRKRMILSALAGLYHQWDKDVRRFIERELKQQRRDIEGAKIAWGIGTSVSDLLRQFGWECQTAAFFPLIDSCHLIVNVFKHGKGRSFDHLKEKYPQYLRDPLVVAGGLPFTEDIPFMEDTLDYEWLQIIEDQFDEFAAGFRQFWEAFPERQPMTYEQWKETSGTAPMK